MDIAHHGFSNADTSRIMYYTNNRLKEGQVNDRNLIIELAQGDIMQSEENLVDYFSKYYFYIMRGTLDYVQECINTKNNRGLLVSLNFILYDVTNYLREKYKNSITLEFYNKVKDILHSKILDSVFVCSIYTSGVLSVNDYIDSIIELFHSLSLTGIIDLDDLKEVFLLDNPHYRKL